MGKCTLEYHETSKCINIRYLPAGVERRAFIQKFVSRFQRVKYNEGKSHCVEIYNIRVWRLMSVFQSIEQSRIHSTHYI